MVSSGDLTPQILSANPYIAGLQGYQAFRPGYAVSVVLQADPGDFGGFGGARWAADGARDAFLAAASAWTAVANVTIQVLAANYQPGGNRSAYTWVETLADLGNTVLGQHNLPGIGNLGGSFNNAVSVFTTASNRPGGFSFVTFLHEIGHGLGLTHPFDGPARFPGVTDASSTGDNEFNTLAYTVMSYSDQIVPGGWESQDYGWAATPMAFDIAAVQYLYGANMSYRTGNDIYRLPTANQPGTYWACIWDAGGIDTISADGGTAGAMIDLRPATLLNEPGGGGWMSRVWGISGGFTIANRVTIENAIGSDFQDRIIGNDAANTVFGGGENDSIDGGAGDDDLKGGDGDDNLLGAAGNDILDGADGYDHLSGGPGNDDLRGGRSNDRLEGGIGNDVLDGGDGNDVLDGGDGLDTMAGGQGDDTYYLSAPGEHYKELAGQGRDTIRAPFNFTMPDNFEFLFLSGGAAVATGNNADNTIFAGTLAATIHGLLGNDTIRGSGANDALYGEDGNDIIDGGSGTDLVIGGVGDDKLSGGLGLDEIHGGDGNDEIYGGVNSIPDPDRYAGASVPMPQPTNDPAADILNGDGGNDSLDGGGGNDVLNGGSGLDTMRGRLGDDTYYIDNAGDVVIEGLNSGTDTVRLMISYTLGDNVENLVLDGTANLAGTGNGLANVLTGNAGANIIDGKGGADQMNGLGGNDNYYIDNAGDIVTEAAGAGTDRVLTYISWTLSANAQVELFTTTDSAGTSAINLTGNAFGQQIIGNAANNIIDGKGGADQMYGLGGNDNYYIDNAGDIVTESAGGGSDRVLTYVSWTLSANAQVELFTTTDSGGTSAINLTGNAFGQQIVGNAGDNSLKGLGGADKLSGGAGNDFLTGGSGQDELNGGPGMDHFLFDALGSANADKIIGFSSVDDTIYLDRTVFTALGAGAFPAGAFAAAAAAQDADDRIVYHSATGNLFYDADGSGAGAAVLFATLAPGTVVGAADFALYA